MITDNDLFVFLFDFQMLVIPRLKIRTEVDITVHNEHIDVYPTRKGTSNRETDGDTQVWSLTCFYLLSFVLEGLVVHNVKQAFFHRFCGNKHNRFSETLSLGEKFFDFRKEFLSLDENF